MIIMSFLKVIFVLLLCVPVAYFAMRLITLLIDQLLGDTKKKRKTQR